MTTATRKFSTRISFNVAWDNPSISVDDVCHAINELINNGLADAASSVDENLGLRDAEIACEIDIGGPEAA